MSIYGLLILARAATNHDGLLVHHMVLVQTDGVLWDVYVQGSSLEFAFLFCNFLLQVTLNPDLRNRLRPYINLLNWCF